MALFLLKADRIAASETFQMCFLWRDPDRLFRARIMGGSDPGRALLEVQQSEAKSPKPNVGAFYQSIGIMNICSSWRIAENRGILPFFETGTPDAMYWATRRDGLTGSQTQENTMTIFASNNFAAAIFSVAISAIVFASAIVPGSPALFV